MSKKDLIKQLQEVKDFGDTENAHIEADDLIIEYINDPEIKKAYEEIDKWYA